MKDLFEIRWHGRGGQGAKTAALLFGEIAAASGKYIQAFPEYGPERMGAPIQSFNRISSEPITLHCGVENPDVVLVLDSSLMDTVDVIKGLSEKGSLIVNTRDKSAVIKKNLGFKGNVWTLDASKISIETIGREMPNTPMMGALVKVIKFLDLKEVLEKARMKLQEKFRHKPEVIEGNVKAIEQAYKTVKGDEVVLKR